MLRPTAKKNNLFLLITNFSLKEKKKYDKENKRKDQFSFNFNVFYA